MSTSTIEITDVSFGLSKQTINLPNQSTPAPSISITPPAPNLQQVFDPNSPSTQLNLINTPSQASAFISQTNGDIQAISPQFTTTPPPSISITPPAIEPEVITSQKLSLTDAQQAALQQEFPNLNFTNGQINFNDPINTDINLKYSPTYVANALNPDPNAPNNNANARLAKQSKNPNATSDPKAEINQGGSAAHTVTKKEIQDLEKQTNLTLYPFLFGGELARIKHQFTNLNLNKYYLLLNLLVYGFDNKILQSGVYGHEKYVIDQQFLNQFLHMAKIPQLQQIIAKTPAGQKGCFKDLGKLGTTQANANNMNSNPMTGPKSEHPGLVSELLERIHPGLTATIDNFCNHVRTKAYLTLPRGSFASLQKLVAAINGVVAALQRIIFGLYNGIMYYIQQFFGIINGLLAKLQQLLMMAIEKIIPPDLLCILIAIFGKFLSDSKFFQSIANFENSINKFQQQVTGYVNQAFAPALALASNPFGAVAKHLPPLVNQIIGALLNFAQDPDAFLSSFIGNFGYGMAMEQTQQGIIEQLDEVLSPVYAAYNSVAKLLKGQVSGGSSQSQQKPPQNLPPSPPQVGSDKYKNGSEDSYGKPIAPEKIGYNQATQGSTIDATNGVLGNGTYGVQKPIGDPQTNSSIQNLNNMIITPDNLKGTPLNETAFLTSPVA